MDIDEDVPDLVEIADAPDAHDHDRRVPLTILTGYLGAGKTTLLQYVLTEQHGRRIAVIMNELANTADIEARTINVSSAAGMSEEILELANGCLCCSVKDTGAAAIEKLMRKKGKFDYILLETTGVADPGPIAAMFWLNEDLASDIYLDGVVCVVDAVFGLRQLEDRNETSAHRQVACADVILLNKLDLVDTNQIETLHRFIRSINPIAPLHITRRGIIDLSFILSLDAYEKVSTLPSSFLQSGCHGHSHGHEEECIGHGHSHEAAEHLTGISTCVVELPVLRDAQIERLDEFVRALLWEGLVLAGEHRGRVEILRCKGFFSSITGAVFVLQGVQDIYNIVQLPDRSGPAAGKLAFIGKSVDSGALESGLKRHLDIGISDTGQMSVVAEI